MPQEYNTAEKFVVCRIKIDGGARTVAVGTSLMTLADAMPESLKLYVGNGAKSTAPSGSDARVGAPAARLLGL